MHTSVEIGNISVNMGVNRVGLSSESRIQLALVNAVASRQTCRNRLNQLIIEVNGLCGRGKLVQAVGLYPGVEVGDVRVNMGVNSVGFSGEPCVQLTLVNRVAI